MASLNKPNVRNACTVVCEAIEIACEAKRQEATEKALRIRDVSLSEAKALRRAIDLVQTEFDTFGAEMRSLYSNPPWSEIAEILIENSKQQFFFSDAGLLGNVHNIILGKPLEKARPSSPTWDWDSD